MSFRRGNTYALRVQLERKRDGQLIDIADVEKVEFMIGKNIRKMYPSEVTYDNNYFIIPITQQDTFQLSGKGVPCQARVLFTSGAVKGTEIPWENVLDSLSEEVLT